MKKQFLFLLALTSTLLLQAQTEATLDAKATKKWFKKKAWTAGFSWSPHKSINKSTFAYQYAAHRRLWDTAFAFLRTNNLSTLEKGDYKLAGDSAVVKVSYGPVKEEKDAKWETHRRMIDLQLVGSGRERIGVADAAGATVTVPYSEEKDVTNLEAEGKYYIAEPGTFFIFFPEDAHRPGIKLDDANVRKIVVKILVAK